MKIVKKIIIQDIKVIAMNKLKGEFYCMGNFNIGDKVVVTKHNKDMEYPTISTLANELFNLVGTICQVGEEDVFEDGSICYGSNLK